MPDAIEARGLTKRYGKIAAAEAIDLRIPAGEVFGFLGPNGAGKSTTTKMLTTLIRPSAGDARVGGFDVRTQYLDVRRIIGYLPERVPVYRTMTAEEYLDTFARMHRLAPTERRRRIAALLDQVNLKGVGGKAVGAYSKGMTQRLGLARALINDPQVVFLDEPASGLDPTGRREIRVLMKDLAKAGKTVFLCTHDLLEAQAVCDRIGFIRKGKLVSTRKVGEVVVGERHILVLEVEALAPALFDAVRGMEGVAEAREEAGRMWIEFVPPATRQSLARAVQKAGGIVFGIEERLPTVEKLYQEYVENEPAPAAPAEGSA